MNTPKPMIQTVKRAVVYFALLASLLFILYMLTGHCALEDIICYAPTIRKLMILLALCVTTAVLLLVDIKRKTPASGPTLVMSLVTILATGYFASYVVLPKYIRSGEVPRMNFFTGTGPEARPFHFAAAGDAHIGNLESRTDPTLRMIGHIKRGSYDAFFLLGDLVDLGFNYSLWPEAFRDMELLSRSVPVCYVPGNHDTMFGGEDFYRKYAVPDSGGPMWRRIDAGTVHFLVLDVEWITQTYTREQEQWLIRQLRGIPGKDWCIVMSHSFYYCSGRNKDGWNWYDNEPLIRRLTPLFEKHGVDLVLSGHMHQTEILKKNGVTYAVVGSFGGRPDSGREYVSPASVWYGARQYGFADVTIRGDNVVLNVRDTENRVLYSTILINR